MRGMLAWLAAAVILTSVLAIGYFAALGDSITSDIILKTSNTGFTNSAYEYTAGGYVVPEEDILHYDGGYSTYSSKPVPVNVLGDEELMAISGYVFDSAGNPLAGVPVELEDEGWTMWLEDTTDGDGYFEFAGLLQGLYGLVINGEEMTGCDVRNYMDCHSITNREDCENSYYEYCSGPEWQYCGMPEGECGYFPCFWGDIGEGEACYFTCDECMFGINQSFLEGYTSINFDDENVINLTGDLEINATLLKMDAKLELNSSAYQNGDVIKANVTVKNNEAFNLINWAAAFGVWGENDGDEELYFNLTPTNLLAGQTRSYIFTYKIPENNTYDELYVFGGAGNLNWNVPSSQGILAALIYKTDEREIRIGDSDGDGINDNVDNCPYDYNPGQEDSDGNGIGNVCELSIAISGYVFDSAGNPLASVPIELGDEGGTLWLEDKTNENGYFEFSNLEKGVYKLYINNEDDILEGYTAVEFEERFSKMINLTGDLEINVTLLKIDTKLEFNASNFKNGDTVEANVTITNNEAFNLINWAFVLGVDFENETYYEELYFNLTPTNLLAGETKSHIFILNIPEDNPYPEVYVYGGIGNDNWNVVSSHGILTALIYKIDEKEIKIHFGVLTGDVNGDCIVNIFDLAHVGLCYGKQPVGFCDTADIHPPPNGNGVINIFDLATVGLNYGKSC